MNEIAPPKGPWFNNPPRSSRQAESTSHTGVLPFQALNQLIRDGVISSDANINPDQVQPASIDLRLGKTAYRVRASFLPGPKATVKERISELDGLTINLGDGAVLERGCVYVIPLQERIALANQPKILVGMANPKSSTGRLDVLTRLITDYGTAFDEISSLYSGPLYLEVAPRAFSVVVRPGTRLAQLRFKRGTAEIASTVLQNSFKDRKLVSPVPQLLPHRDGRVPVTIDLVGDGKDSLIGYRAQKHTDRIDVDRIDFYEVKDFWEPIFNNQDGRIILNPDDFYILATRESVAVPPEFAAEMVAYDTTVGEFRVHYAGFFDPGFGCDSNSLGSKAVLEVRSHAVPFMLEHKQIIGWLRYERMMAVPDRLYGVGIKSNYQNQGLQLAKQFRKVAVI